MTQKNSKPRVKEDGIGEDVMKELFASFDTTGVNDFRSMCINIIQKSNGKSETKDSFIDMLNSAKSKQVMAIKVTNYFLAGEGKGV